MKQTDASAAIIISGYRDRLVKQVRASIETLRKCKGMEAYSYAQAVMTEMQNIGVAFNDLEVVEATASEPSKTPEWDNAENRCT